MLILIALPAGGLSPPTRGSRLRVGQSAVSGGSIPAHAGEPNTNLTDGRGIAVYPRPRGGAGGALDGERHGEGLSPPTRGSPGHADP